MQIQVSGHQVEMSDALRVYVSDRLQDGVGKYFSNPMDAHVAFRREGSGYRVDCSVHVGSGVDAQSHASDNDIHLAFDQAAEKLEKRLRRYKRRLRDHHHRERPKTDALLAQSYVLAPESDEELPAEFQPVIVAETASDIHTRSVGDAVMQLDLGEQPVLLFRNSGNGHLNVVYRRPDGHIGWVDLVEAGAAPAKAQ